ncbi:MAG: fibronectin type III domain-containing protein [bacterium]
MRYSTILLFTVLFAVACAKKPTAPSEVPTDLFPQKPFNLKAQVADETVNLSWEISDPSNILNYNVYRKSEADSVLKLIAATEAQNFTDTGLGNGVEYVYKVSAVDQNRFEGELSEAIKAVPNLFSVIIESNAEYTNTPSVSLTFTAPDRTSFVKVSNDSTLAGGQFESFVSSKTWQLSSGDGVKTVYAVFRDEFGNETSPPVTDSIILDTEALILRVTENTGGRVVTSGETIHFTLESQELNGTAAVTLQDGPTIALFDDGRAGDPVAEDGVYERDYVVPFGVQVTKAVVTGRFVDIAQNEADAVNASGLVTIQTPPSPVNLFTPNPSDATFSSVQLSWSENTDSDFSEYRIYRSKSAGVNLQSTFVASLAQQSTTNFEDTGLDENTTYFYKVYVFDNFGLSAESNEVSVTTKSNDPPTAVTLFQPAPVANVANALDVSWTQNSDSDFSQYRVYRSTSPGVDLTSSLVTSIFSQTTTNFQDTDLVSGTTYYYRVYVFDTDGLSTGSNEESATVK